MSQLPPSSDRDDVGRDLPAVVASPGSGSARVTVGHRAVALNFSPSPMLKLGMTRQKEPDA
jgi:hypothetical protein